ncbi:helix-turn-helix domain-containing protein [Micromonospora sp. DR5-3]|uniref:winged helix-turn-helix domain-containing protein n=1 Tax=unclassified Micromonospora TaxID=2617518 RepID=UPI0011D8503F|nr:MULTISPECIES: helix-turn-helix domain-containing protein [unclassified Micromonospora]MCW3817919.1 helix-turn-helix domain-containing protein [Micromonospora sp. DR5-3]TYC19254.1 helix-turn-helix transcriptional regulator [Micromonospora sp. MP36]
MSGNLAGEDAIRDVKQLKAFAHPLRVRLYYELGLAGAATVTQLAQAVGGAVALVSYHLHQLADFGFIEPAPERAGNNKKERWWKLSQQRLRWSDADLLSQPGGAEATSMIQSGVVRLQYEQVQRYYRNRSALPEEWVNAAFSDDGVLNLTAQELASMHADLQELVRRYRERADQAAGTQTRRPTVVILHGFPLTQADPPAQG